MKTLLLSLFISSLALAQEKTTDFAGVWMNSKKDAFIKLEQTDKIVDGFIYAVIKEKEFQKDDKNPDVNQHDKRVLGLKNFIGFTLKDATHAENGKAYDPKNGKTYSAKMWLESPNELKIRGYIGISLFGRSETFSRVQGAIDEEAAKLNLVTLPK